MAARDIVDANLSETKIEEEDCLRTVDGLRGRLLAERLASRNATKEAEQLGNKLVELEKQLKEEARSRNRAEKKLKMLMKRLQSMKFVQQNAKSANLEENNLQISEWNVFDDIEERWSSNEHPLISSSSSDKTFHVDDNQMFDDSTTNHKRMESCSEEGLNYQEDDDQKLMAMIAIEMPKKKEKIDPRVVDESVKEVLQSLQRAKKQLQSSMQRSTSMSMIRVG